MESDVFYNQFIKYVIVGGSGVVLDIGSLWLLHTELGIVSWGAVALNQILLIAYNFSLNKYWSFQNKEMPHTQFVRYMTLFGLNYLISIGVMYVGNGRLGYDALWVRIGTIAAMVSWNFFLYKYWVFRKEKIEECYTHFPS